MQDGKTIVDTVSYEDDVPVVLEPGQLEMPMAVNQPSDMSSLLPPTPVGKADLPLHWQSQRTALCGLGYIYIAHIIIIAD